jgi:hypothetical protein
MMLLLAVCGWIAGGTERVHWALIGGPPRPNGPALADAATMYRWFGPRLLRPAEQPGLLNILAVACSRARLSRLRDLYCLPAPSDMIPARFAEDRMRRFVVTLKTPHKPLKAKKGDDEENQTEEARRLGSRLN